MELSYSSFGSVSQSQTKTPVSTGSMNVLFSSTQGEKPPVVCRKYDEESSKGRATRHKCRQTKGGKVAKRERRPDFKIRIRAKELEKKEARMVKQPIMQRIVNATPMNPTAAGDQCFTPTPVKPTAAGGQCLTPTPMKPAAICENDYRTPLPVARTSNSDVDSRFQLFASSLDKSLVLVKGQCDLGIQTLDNNFAQMHHSVGASNSLFSRHVEGAIGQFAGACQYTSPNDLERGGNGVQKTLQIFQASLTDGSHTSAPNNQAINEKPVSFRYDLPTGEVDNWSHEGANMYCDLRDLLVEVQAIKAADEQEKAARARQLMSKVNQVTVDGASRPRGETKYLKHCKNYLVEECNKFL